MPTAPRDEVGPSPWDRFAWVMGVVWIFFLYFPIRSTAESGLPPGPLAVSLGAQIAFGVVYIAGFVIITRVPEGGDVWRRAWPVLALLIVLTIVPTWFVGVEALGVIPFIMATAMFSASLPRSIAMAGALLAILAVAIVAAGAFGDLWFLLAPGVIVMSMTGIVRWVGEQQSNYDELGRQLDIVAERERVARDVHDTLGHSLTVVTVKAELAERLVDLDPERAKAEVAQIRSLAREALAEVRATVAGLRVARLGDELAAARGALEGAGVAHDVPESADVVDPRRRIVVAWILREAVTNVVRHANASACAVRLASDGLVVEDDGVGIAPVRADTGLRGMRERAEAAGAALSVGPGADGRGTRVEVRW